MSSYDVEPPHVPSKQTGCHQQAKCKVLILRCLFNSMRLTTGQKSGSAATFVGAGSAAANLSGLGRQSNLEIKNCDVERITSSARSTTTCLQEVTRID
jgi:hypothetical protein